MGGGGDFIVYLNLKVNTGEEKYWVHLRLCESEPKI